MARSLLTLPWLRPRGEATARLMEAAGALDALEGTALMALAQEDLSANHRRRIARRVARGPDCGLRKVRLCVAAQSSADFWVDELVVGALRFGLALEVVKAPYNQLGAIAFGDFFSDGPGQGCALTFVALDAIQLGLSGHGYLDPGLAQQRVDSALQSLRAQLEGIANRSGAPCLVQNLVTPFDTWVASADAGSPGTTEWMVRQFNAGLPALLANAHYLFDAASLAAQVGIQSWHDPGMWHLAKASPAQAVVPWYTHRLAAVIASVLGKARRVLILDLDNTVWGGVIGDDGVDGIVLGQGSAAGEAFLAVQKMALQLRSRGVVLAVCSKNDEKIARAAFESHPEMVLKLDDIAAFVANWNDKASNIRAIASHLSLGLDAMVFLDDNPAERELVRRELPQVAVPEPGDDPSDYPQAVLGPGYFEAVALSAEDLARARMYSDNARRVRQLESVGDMDAYLDSLQMRMTIRPFDSVGRARIVQLIGKSNQFNLTTRRYSVADVQALEADPAALTLQVRLEDRFGDNGMICVVICRPEGEDWEIDTWLMSCRVLKRRVEEQVLQYVVGQARSRGIRRLKGAYIPTERNGIVKDHYVQLGFAPGASDATRSEWWLEVDGYADKRLPFDVIVSEAQEAAHG